VSTLYLFWFPSLADELNPSDQEQNKQHDDYCADQAAAYIHFVSSQSALVQFELH
jgi:hypothetical protein